MINWRALLLIYPRLEVRLPGGWFRRRTFNHQLSETEIQDALRSFACFPALAQDCAQGEISLSTSVQRIARPLDSLTAMGTGIYWPSPSDTKLELDDLLPPGTFDSVFVLWPQQNLQTGELVPSGGWGCCRNFLFSVLLRFVL